MGPTVQAGRPPLSSHPPSWSEHAGYCLLTVVSHSVLATGGMAGPGSPSERRQLGTAGVCPPALWCDPRSCFTNADCRVQQWDPDVFSLPYFCAQTHMVFVAALPNATQGKFSLKIYRSIISWSFSTSFKIKFSRL